MDRNEQGIGFGTIRGMWDVFCVLYVELSESESESESEAKARVWRIFCLDVRVRNET